VRHWNTTVQLTRNTKMGCETCLALVRLLAPRHKGRLIQWQVELLAHDVDGLHDLCCIRNLFLCSLSSGLRPHATQGTQTPNNLNDLFTIKNIERPGVAPTQGTRPPNNYNALLTIKNIESHVCNAEKAYLRVRGVGVA
jgi:hypothetical protein